MDTPKYYEFMNATLQALREGGGTLTNEEIVDVVARIMNLPDEVMERQQAGHNMGEVEYRIAWAKTYLKQSGYLTQSARGVWALTPEGKATETVDERSIVAEVRKDYRARRKAKTVGADVVRDFRGAMIGRADKGLIISTGIFSRDARAEAIRDGAPAIDLVDGQELAALLKQYELGVKTVMVEKVLVDGEWFGGI